ncbi:hypothetical protein ACFTAO_05800 [Paenibacillus rhizoplanae]
MVSDYGGSNWRWYNKYRFRYQDKDWFLIGATSGSYFTGAATMDQADEDDINFFDRTIYRAENGRTRKYHNEKKELGGKKAFDPPNGV